MSESELPPVDHGTGKQARGGRSLRFPPVELYKVAYQEILRTLDDQQTELKEIRDWAVQFTAFVGAGTVVLVATGIHDSHRNAAFYTVVAVASFLSAMLIVLLFVLFQPSRTRPWSYRISATALIDGWIETDVQPTEAQFLRELAQTYDKLSAQNEQTLGFNRSCYRWLIIIGSLQLALWVVLALAKF